MPTRSPPAALGSSRQELELRAQLAVSEADFMAARARECDRWGLVLEARDMRHAARAQRIASLLLLGRAAAAAST